MQQRFGESGGAVLRRTICTQTIQFGVIDAIALTVDFLLF